MRPRDLVVLSVVIVAAMIIAAVAVAPTLPANTELPVHWNAAGQADGFAAPWTALLAVPLLAGGLAGLMALLPRLDQGVAASPELHRAAWLGILLVLAAADAAIVLAARGAPPPRLIVPLAVGALLILVGNVMGKSRPNRLIGVRTPWTRANPDTWTATNRLGGFVFVGFGLAMWLAAALGVPALPWLTAGLVAASVGLVGYSWRDASRRR